MRSIRYNLLNYAASKLSGLGFCLLFISFAGVIAGELDVHGFIQSFYENRAGWIIIIYSLGCSIAIDLLAYPLRRYKELVKVILYIIAGAGFFIFQVSHPIAIFFGLLGALCSLFFYFGTWIAHIDSPFKYLLSIVVPLCFLLIGISCL
ncbi:hypothetical protein SD71_12260 [Cohnella kolymensis]|uniref:Prepilin type IV endopeptidase peptidase domain-containing protein n=1 Tax=Cohnella kolymensis TaxID=1590652 RepID=A0ABR5A519_9BACL|nr:hypothetical protein [Cohnella kolymensis]KIL35665.1 hypothetical protein SD71_12260 [Cohnella kolymensis]